MGKLVGKAFSSVAETEFEVGQGLIVGLAEFVDLLYFLYGELVFHFEGLEDLSL